MLTKLDKYSCVKNMALARAIPYSPNILFTAIAVLSKLTSREHLKSTLIGKIPSVIIEVWLGHDLIYFSEHGTRFIVLLFLLLAAYIIHKMYKKDAVLTTNVCNQSRHGFHDGFPWMKSESPPFVSLLSIV